jgi:hypothetical protein
VRVIPVLVDGARMPNAEELPEVVSILDPVGGALSRERLP